MIGSILREARAKKGYTMKDIKALTGIFEPNYSDYESEKTVPLKHVTIVKLANALELDAENLEIIAIIDSGNIPPVLQSDKEFMDDLYGRFS